MRRFRYDAAYLFRRFVYCAGLLSLFVVLMIVVLACVCKIEYTTEKTPVASGVVEKMMYDNGFDWYNTWKIGVFTLTERHHEGSGYYVVVSDGVNEDLWQVSKKEYESLSVGDYVKR